MEGQLKNGTILTSESGNKYKVENLLGAGGQGEVYDVECDGKLPAYEQESGLHQGMHLRMPYQPCRKHLPYAVLLLHQSHLCMHAADN